MAKQSAVNLHDLSPEAQKALGVKVTGKGREEVDRLAMRLVGVLADASSNEVRRRALEKARRMLSAR